MRATGCWELPAMHGVWQRGGIEAVHDFMAADPMGFTQESSVQGAAESFSSRPVMARPPGASTTSNRPALDNDDDDGPTAGGMGRRRVLVHPSGFKQSPYADIKPAGEDSKKVPRHLWHRSPGSAG